MNVPDVPQPGQVLAGKYRVERKIGEGGMGWVLAARHVELDTRMALKVLRPDAMSSAEARERFRREARVVGSLESDYVARVFDFGTLENGSLYVAMELLEGNDLDAEIRQRGPLPIAEAVEYFLQACEGLAEAHAREVIHRDLKPKNLFVARRVDGRRVMKVLDFGVAKTGTGAGEESLTRVDDVIGTPRYIAPEQLRSAKIIDARADVWAIGVTLYEALTGVPPFDGVNEVVVYAAILQQEPQPLRKRRPEVPEGLERIINKCLAKRADDRFQTVLELAVALEAFAPQAKGTAARIHATFSRNSPNPVPMPLPQASDPSIGTGSALTKRRMQAIPNLIPWAVGFVALVFLVIVAAVLAASRSEDSVPPATTAEPVKPASPAPRATR